MRVEYTKTQRRILEAVDRGYSVSEEGILTGPKGVLKVSKYGSQRYPTFSTNWGGYVYGVPSHHLAAYCFYGEHAFTPGLVVRHLDGDTLNLSKVNIVMGTHSQNNLDKPKKVRSAAARKARASQGRTPTNAKLTPSQAEAVRGFYRDLGGGKVPNGLASFLAGELGVSRKVLHNIKVGVSYAV